MTRRCLLAVAVFIVAAGAFAQQQQVPTPEQYLGYPLGERFTPQHRILDYLGELSRRSDLITLQTFGRSYEERPLVLATITSAKNRAALDQIRGDLAAMARGEIDGAQLPADSPAVVWLAFGVHGNESSSSEAAMRVAATLVGDPQSASLLDELIVLIDPLENPDGRERYTGWFTQSRGAEANANPESFEHAEQWPGGRYNHYLIDMNRDWAWASQRESQARVAEYLRWYPQVFVDFHEMGTQSSYFFPPAAKPINTNLRADVEKWLDEFGRANAEAFSKKGWPFFVGEHFDLFYPGYGDSWPSLHGAIGMTYEVAGGGRGGTVIEREDGSMLTLADRIDRHYTTAMATLRTAAANREALLRYTRDVMRINTDSAGTSYLLVPGSPSLPDLVDVLRRQEIRMSMLSAPVSVRATRLEGGSAESRNFPAGTVVISTRQPLGSLVQTLLERHATMAQTFLEQQRAKAEADEPDDFYDLTTWSLPLAMNVEAWTTASTPGQLAPLTLPAARVFQAADYGYAVSGLEPNLYRLIGRLLKNDVHFTASDSDFTAGERSWPRGTIVILKGNNRPELDAVLRKAVAALNVEVVPLGSGWAGGTAFGSDKLHYVRDPKIALIGGQGTSPTSFGMIWHTLEIDTPIPHTVLNAKSLRNADLTRYRVIVLPDGNYTDHFGKNEVEKLQGWLRGGGTLVAVKGASSWLRAKEVEISKLKSWEKKKEDAKEGDEPPPPDRYNLPRVPGSAFRTTMNERSYLTFGLRRSPAVLIEGTTALLPVVHRVDNVVTVAAKDALLSGVAWPDSLERIEGAAFLVSEPYGKGSVVTFADEPHFRLFWRGTLPLFLNAVVYSPSFQR